jgi:hypothetical protein
MVLNAYSGVNRPVFWAIFDEKDYVEVFTKRTRGLGFDFIDEELNLFFGENVQDYLDLDL